MKHPHRTSKHNRTTPTLASLLLPLFITLCALNTTTRAHHATDGDSERSDEEQRLINTFGVSHIQFPQQLRTDDPDFDEYTLWDVIDIMQSNCFEERWVCLGGEDAAIIHADLGTIQIAAPLNVVADCRWFIQRLTLVLSGDDSIEHAIRQEWRRNPPPHHWIIDAEYPEFPDLRPNHERGLTMYDLTTLHQLLDKAFIPDERAERRRNPPHFSTPSIFNEPESSLDLVDVRDERNSELICEFIQSFVEPEGWFDLGGDLATYRTLGPVAIIDAPAHLHLNIEDLLERCTNALRGNFDNEHERLRHWQSPWYATTEKNPELLIHDITSLIEHSADPERTAQDIIDFIQKEITPEDWIDVGGDIASAVAYIPGLLIINHNPEQQRRIDAILKALRQSQ